MPLPFDRCQKAGGKIRTKKLGGGKYVHFCILKGKMFRGYVKTKKK